MYDDDDDDDDDDNGGGDVNRFSARAMMWDCTTYMYKYVQCL